MRTFYAYRPARDAVLVLFAAASIAIGGCSSNITDQSVVNIPPDELTRWVRESSEKRLLIDVRDTEAFAQGHISGARNLRLQDVSATEKKPNLDRYTTIVVYGQDAASARAVAMTKRLLGVGYKDIRLYQSGFSGWQARGGSTHRGQ